MYPGVPASRASDNPTITNRDRGTRGPTRLFKRLRSGSLQDKVQLWSRAAAPPGCLQPGFAFAPSHIPTEGVIVGRSPELARPPLFIFAERILYGKTKKSTHGHTNVKPFCTHFLKSSSTDRARRADSNSTPQTFHRRLVRALRAFKVGATG